MFFLKTIQYFYYICCQVVAFCLIFCSLVANRVCGKKEDLKVIVSQIKPKKEMDSNMATITKEKSAELIAKFGGNEKNSGNICVQVAILTEKIKNLTEHAKQHRKDFHSLRGLTAMVAKRKTLLKYYASRDIEGYRALIKELGLRG